MKSGFFIACEKQSIHIWIQEPYQEAKEKFPVALMQTSFHTVFRVGKKVCAVFKFIFTKKLFNQQVALSKMPSNAAKIYQETDFRSTDGRLLTSRGCFLT